MKTMEKIVRNLMVAECEVLIEELNESNLESCRDYLRGLIITQSKG